MKKGFYKGIAIEKMSRKELIAALIEMCELYMIVLKKYVHEKGS